MKSYGQGKIRMWLYHPLLNSAIRFHHTQARVQNIWNSTLQCRKGGHIKKAGQQINVTLSGTEVQGDVDCILQLLVETSHSTRLLAK